MYKRAVNIADGIQGHFLGINQTMSQCGMPIITWTDNTCAISHCLYFAYGRIALLTGEDPKNKEGCVETWGYNSFVGIG